MPSRARPYGPPSAPNTTVSLDLFEHQTRAALVAATAAASERAAALAARDDSLLPLALGATYEELLTRATARRASESVSRQATQLTHLLTRPGSRVGALARLPGDGAATAFATARGLPPRLDVVDSSFTSEERDLQGIFSGTSRAFEASAASAAAVDTQHIAAGLMRAGTVQWDELEAQRIAAGLTSAQRKRRLLGGSPAAATMTTSTLSPTLRAASASAAQRRPTASPALAAARSDYVLDIPELPAGARGPPHRAIAQRFEEDAYGLPSGSPSREAPLTGRAPTPSPYDPRTLLPQLPQSPTPAAMHAGDTRRFLEGSGGGALLHPSAVSMRDRNPERELGRSRILTGVLNAEPRRAFKAGGLLDVEATVRIEAAAAASCTSPGTHPFRGSKTARASDSLAVAEPWQQPEAWAIIGACGKASDATARAPEVCVGRPYTLVPRVVSELAVDPATPWAAWTTPVIKAPDDLRASVRSLPGASGRAQRQSTSPASRQLHLSRGRQPPTSPLVLATVSLLRAEQEGVAEQHDEQQQQQEEEEEERDAPPATESHEGGGEEVGVASPSPAASSAKGEAEKESGGSASPTWRPPAIVTSSSYGGGLPPSPGRVATRLSATASPSFTSPPLNLQQLPLSPQHCHGRHGHSSDPGSRAPHHLLLKPSHGHAAVSGHATIASVPTVSGGAPRSPRSARFDVFARVVVAAETSRSLPRLVKRGAAAAVAHETAVMDSLGVGLESARSFPSSPAFTRTSPRSTSAGALASPVLTSASGAKVLHAAATKIDLHWFAATGVDPLREASRAASARGAPPPLDHPSQWQGPWQGGPVPYDTFATSPWRDGRGYYRRGKLGQPHGSPRSQAPSVLVDSPRAAPSPRVHVDPHLAAPTHAEQLAALSPRSASSGGVGRLVTGSLEASLLLREATRDLASVLHPAAAKLGRAVA